MTSEISSEKKACIDCKHHVALESMYYGTFHKCIRPISPIFDNVTGWKNRTVGYECRNCRAGYIDGVDPVDSDRVCGEQAIHFQPKPVLPPKVVTKGIKAIPVKTGVSWGLNDEFEETKDDRVFWCTIIAALAFGAWCLFK